MGASVRTAVRSGVLAVLLLATACTTGSTTSVVPAPQEHLDAAAVGVVPAEPAPQRGAVSSSVIGELCRDHCDQLQGAGSGTCPRPIEDVSLCVPYLTRLYASVALVDARIAGLGAGYEPLLAATRSALTVAQRFEQDACYGVTAGATAADAACRDRVLELRGAAVRVGRLLEAALD